MRPCSSPSTLVPIASRQTSRSGSTSRSALGLPALKTPRPRGRTRRRPRRRVAYLLELRHVGGHTDGVEPVRELRDRGSQSLGPARREHQLHPPACERGGGGATDAGRCAGDDCDLPFEIHAVDLHAVEHHPSARRVELRLVSFFGLQSNVPGFDGYVAHPLLVLHLHHQEARPGLPLGDVVHADHAAGVEAGDSLYRGPTRPPGSPVGAALGDRSSTACLNSNVAANP